MDPHPTDPQPGACCAPAPNHHSSHPGFSGATGLLAAVSFLFGRADAAKLAIELSGLGPGDRLVDVGCGPGIAAQRARALGAEVIAIDPAPVMLRVARVRWRSDPGVSWRIGTAESLPVPDSWAQVVWSLATVHHWADVDAGLEETARVLAPGGRLIVLERRIDDTEAPGAASHGWTLDQSESFATCCRRRGFEAVAHAGPTGNGSLLAVVARCPGGEER